MKHALATLVCLLTVGIALVRRKGRTAKLASWMLLSAWGIYLVLGSLVAIATPQTVLARNDARCFDEMCFQIASVERSSTFTLNGTPTAPQGVFYLVTVRTFSRSLGHPQREGGATAVLLDAAHHQYQPAFNLMNTEPLTGGYAASLDSEIAPGQSALTRFIFDVPASASIAGLAILHSYKFNPARIILGDDQHLFHPPTVLKLQP